MRRWLANRRHARTPKHITYLERELARLDQIINDDPEPPRPSRPTTITTTGYAPQTWEDRNPAHPLSAARLTHIEDGIVSAHARFDRLTRRLQLLEEEHEQARFASTRIPMAHLAPASDHRRTGRDAHDRPLALTAGRAEAYELWGLATPDKRSVRR